MDRLFIWLSGADYGILQACSKLSKSERTRFVGIGALVLIPAILGLFSMMYAVSTITSDSTVFIAAGIGWSLVVLIVDRFLVSTTYRSALKGTWRNWVGLAARYVFAIFVGVAVSHPLVLLWFDASITKRLLDNKSEETGRELQKSLDAQSNLRPDDDLLNSKTERRDCLQKLLTAEQSGNKVELDCGDSSGLLDCGSRCGKIQDQIDRFNAEIDQLSERIAEERKQNKVQADLISTRSNERIEEIEKNFSSDYLARVRALGEIEEESSHVTYVKWFMLLFFVFVDILPITMKLSTPMGEYEHRRDTLLFEAQVTQEAERDVMAANYGSSAYRSSLRARLNHDTIREEISSITQTTIDFIKEQERQSENFDRQFKEINGRISRIKDEELRQYYQAYVGRIKGIFNEAWTKAMSRFHAYLEGL